MVSRRFRNRLNLSGGPSGAVAARIEALEEGDIRIYRKDLALVAEQGSEFDQSIRLAAIAKLDDVTLLVNLLDEGADTAKAAADSIARLILAEQRNEHSSLLEIGAVRLAFVRASRDAETVQAMLDELEEAQLVDVACNASFVGVRRAAADRVHGESALANIAGNAKSHDKSVFRIARTRLAHIRAARRTLAQADERAEDIAARLAELSQMPMDRTLGATLRIIAQAWQECETAREHALESAPQLKEASTGLSAADSYAQARQRIEARLSHEQLVQEAAPASNTLAAGRETPVSEQSMSVLDKEGIEKLSAWVADLPPETASPKRLEQYRSLWSEAHKLDQTNRRVARSAALLERRVDDAHAPLRKQVNTWQDAYRRYAKAVESIEAGLLETFESQAKALAEHIELGHLGKVNELRHQCGDTLRMLPEARARHLWKRLADTDNQIRPLRDWQAYAATPKRESLCERMAEIADQPLSPNEQIDRIRALRNEWNAMGPLIGGRDHELRRRFERLADTAFAPCRAHFQEQAEVRKQNLAARRQICEELEFFIAEKDWDQPDWKMVERILRTARNEWRAAHPIDRARTKSMQRRFDGLCDDLFGRLSSHWKANEVKARGLILELRALLESTGSLERLVEATSAIQARWREVGPMSKSANRKLWKEFRGLADQVYAQRRAHRSQENQAYQDRVSAARQLVEQLEETLEKASIETVSAGELTQLSEQWESFKESQGESFKRLQNKWRDLSRRYRQMLRDGDAARQLRLLELASRIDSNLCEAEQALIEGSGGIAETDLETLRGDITSLFGKTVPTRFDRLRQASNIEDSETLDALATRRRMCVMLDIFLERESPPEDKALRLEIQVQRINRGSGSVLDQQEDPLEVAREWCRTGPVGQAADQLNGRFFATIKEMTH